MIYTSIYCLIFCDINPYCKKFCQLLTVGRYYCKFVSFCTRKADL